MTSNQAQVQLLAINPVSSDRLRQEAQDSAIRPLNYLPHMLTDVAVRQTVRHALEAGAKKQEIIEAIGQMSVFAGLPAMNRALDLASQVIDEKDDKA